MGGVGDFMVNWYNSYERDTPFDFTVDAPSAAWTALTAESELMGGVSNATFYYTINLQSSTQASLNLTFTDKLSGQRVGATSEPCAVRCPAPGLPECAAVSPVTRCSTSFFAESSAWHLPVSQGSGCGE